MGSLGTSNSLDTSSAIEASLSLLELSLDEPLWNDWTLSQLDKKNEIFENHLKNACVILLTVTEKDYLKLHVSYGPFSRLRKFLR